MTFGSGCSSRSGLMADEGAERHNRPVHRAGSPTPTPFQVEASSAEEVEGRAAMTYRFRLHKHNGWQLIEQHLMLDVEPTVASQRSTCCARVSARSRAGVGLGAACTASTRGPRVRRRARREFRQQIQRIPVGHLLVVSTRDPAAKEDLPSLARLMGHVVVSIEAPGDGRLL